MRKLAIAYGGSCRAKTWTNSAVSWEELTGKLKTTFRTNETVTEYSKMDKADREKAKDHGGFVGGLLKDGRRLADQVVCRSMLTLDADEAKPGFIDKFLKENLCVSCVYSTHSHTPLTPRCRIIVPLTRDVSPGEYVALARYFAAEWNIDAFDECSYRVNQLMYWPSSPSDGEFIYGETHGDWLDPDAYLSAHPDWRDCSTLPVSSREGSVKGLPGDRKRMEDPLTKTGTVGDFCRAYPVSGAIAKFLPDVYAPTEQDDRYDYIAGEGRCGVVVYDDKFAYSHHATDPAGGRLLNAFDLVRVHKFKGQDEKQSFKSMCELALRDEEVQKITRNGRSKEAAKEFSIDQQSWDDPFPLSENRLPEFPTDALTPVLRDYAVAVSETTQTSVDMAAVGILTTVSACMRNLYKVQGKPDWLEPTNIYGVIIADPSERKSANLSLNTKPVDEYVRQYNLAHRVEFEISRATKQRLENRKNSLMSASKKKNSDGTTEDFDDAIREIAEELVNFKEKKPLKIYIDDVTPEKLVEALAENNNALSIISSEGGIFDVLSGAYANRVNIDVFLKAYSGEHISVDRIMRNSVAVDDACLTILLSVQPVVIGDLMKNAKFRHRGLTARFLYTHPKSLTGDRKFDTVPISQEIYEAYKKIIYNILEEKRGSTFEIIHLTEDARSVLREFYTWTENRIAGEFSFYSDWIGKLVGNTLRIAGILARSVVIRKNVGDNCLEADEPVMITEEIMRNAVRIGKYFLAHAINAYSTMGVYSDFRAFEKAIDKIRERKLHTICRRELMHICRWISSAEQAQNILSSLEEYSYLRLISIDSSDKLRGGRPKNPTYAVNPKLF